MSNDKRADGGIILGGGIIIGRRADGSITLAKQSTGELIAEKGPQDGGDMIVVVLGKTTVILVDEQG